MFFFRETTTWWPQIHLSTKAMIATPAILSCVLLVTYMCIPYSENEHGPTSHAGTLELKEEIKQLQERVKATQLQLSKVTSDMETSRSKTSRRISELEGKLSMLEAKKANRSDTSYLSKTCITKTEHQTGLDVLTKFKAGALANVYTPDL